LHPFSCDHTRVAMSIMRTFILLLTGCCLLAHGERASAGELRFLSLKTIPAPQPRFDQAMATDRESGRVFLFGGRDGERFFNDLWVLDEKKMSWRKIETGQGPAPRSGHSLVYDKKSGRLILFGGFTTDEFGQIKFFRQLWIFTESKGWSREYFKVGPSGRAWHGTAIIGEKLVIFGGYSSEPRPFLDDVWQMDLENLSFKRAATDGGPKMNGRPALLPLADKDKLLIFGRLGTFNPSSTQRWILDRAADKWTRLAEMGAPNPAYSITMADAKSKRLCIVEIKRDDEAISRVAWCGIQPDGKWERLEMAEGPTTPVGIVCTPDALKPGWICFGGAYRAEVNGQTWLAEPENGDEGGL